MASFGPFIFQTWNTGTSNPESTPIEPVGRILAIIRGEKIVGNTVLTASTFNEIPVSTLSALVRKDPCIKFSAGRIMYNHRMVGYVQQQQSVAMITDPKTGKEISVIKAEQDDNTPFTFNVLVWSPVLNYVCMKTPGYF